MDISRAPDERGFTLVELMVVVMIVAILIGLALPTFLAFRERAEDAAAKEAAAIALRVARSLSEESYAPVTLAAMGATEPSLTFVDGTTPSTGATVVSQESPDALNQSFVISVYSASGTCFFLRDDLGSGTSYATLTGAPSNCHAENTGAVVFSSSW